MAGVSIQSVADAIRAGFQKALGSLDGWPYNPTFFSDPQITVTFSISGIKVLVALADSTGKVLWATPVFLEAWPATPVGNPVGGPTYTFTAKGTYVTASTYTVSVSYWTPGNIENYGARVAFQGTALKAGVSIVQTFDLVTSGVITISTAPGGAATCTGIIQSWGAAANNFTMVGSFSGATGAGLAVTLTTALGPTDAYQAIVTFPGGSTFTSANFTGAELLAGVTVSVPSGTDYTGSIPVSFSIVDPPGPGPVEARFLFQMNDGTILYAKTAPAPAASGAYVATMSVPLSSLSGLDPSTPINYSIVVSGNNAQWELVAGGGALVSQLLTAPAITISTLGESVSVSIGPGVVTS